MARYKVLATSYINNKLVHPGDVVEYKGKAGSNLELVKEKKEAPADPPQGGDAGDAKDPIV